MEYELVRYQIVDEATPALRAIVKASQDADRAAARLATASKGAAKGVDDLAQAAAAEAAALRAADEATRKWATQLGVSSSKLGELSNKLAIADQALEEQTQKLIDARNYLDEYGATQEEQQRILSKLIDGSERYNLTLGKQALVLEELAIELQDTAQVERVLGEALAYVERVGGRAEDAIATFTEALKGDTAALSKIGPVAAAAADGLDRVRDRSLRAAEVTRIFRQEVNRTPDVLDKLNDRLAIGQARLSLFLARVGPVGAGLGGLAASLGGALLVGLDKFIEKNAEAGKAMKAASDGGEDLVATFGELVAREFGLVGFLTEVGAGFRDLAKSIQVTDVEAQRLIARGQQARTQTQRQQFRAQGDFSADREAGAIGRDPVADQQRLLQRTQDDLLRGQQIEAEERRRLAEQERRTQERRTRIGELTDADLLGLGARGLDADVIGALGNDVLARSGPLLPSGRFESDGSTAPRTSSRQGAAPTQGPVGAGIFSGLQEFVERAGQVTQERGELIGAALQVQTMLEERNRVEADLLRELDQQERSRREARVGEIGSLVMGLGGEEGVREALGIQGDINDISEPTLDALRQMSDESQRLTESLSGIATEGVNSAVLGLAKLGAAFATGKAKAKDFGGAFLELLGGVLSQAGQGLILLGLGTAQVKAGVPNPAALIAIGAGLVLAGEAAGAFAPKGGGSSSASAETATRNAFRESTDRLLEREKERTTIVLNNFFGQEKIDQLVIDTTQRAAAQGLL